MDEENREEKRLEKEVPRRILPFTVSKMKTLDSLFQDKVWKKEIFRLDRDDSDQHWRKIKQIDEKEKLRKNFPRMSTEVIDVRLFNHYAQGLSVCSPCTSASLDQLSSWPRWRELGLAFKTSSTFAQHSFYGLALNLILMWPLKLSPRVVISVYNHPF